MISLPRLYAILDSSYFADTEALCLAAGTWPPAALPCCNIATNPAMRGRCWNRHES